uniref:Uncharacterized protein n=1 Tax=Strombidium inclinatum TaxID=197538 RepID=A0A7S3IKT3_9SPIT|mmetsp:Transcript_2165/g.3230  ORF Transcript_2165/g.3230 Transcript_2165/m.3230 type:complete len:110 (+) Transcript_2165:139-468(+)
MRANDFDSEGNQHVLQFSSFPSSPSGFYPKTYQVIDEWPQSWEMSVVQSCMTKKDKFSLCLYDLHKNDLSILNCDPRATSELDYLFITSKKTGKVELLREAVDEKLEEY